MTVLKKSPPIVFIALSLSLSSTMTNYYLFSWPANHTWEVLFSYKQSSLQWCSKLTFLCFSTISLTSSVSFKENFFCFNLLDSCPMIQPRRFEFILRMCCWIYFFLLYFLKIHSESSKSRYHLFLGISGFLRLCAAWFVNFTLITCLFLVCTTEGWHGTSPQKHPKIMLCFCNMVVIAVLWPSREYPLSIVQEVLLLIMYSSVYPLGYLSCSTTSTDFTFVMLWNLVLFLPDPDLSTFLSSVCLVNLSFVSSSTF